MNITRIKSTQRIGLLLGFIFLLPALFFSVYEISSLNREEEMIQQVYNKQLEAILFSVNQYSDDILNSWISKIEAGMEEASSENEMPSKINTLLNFYSSITHICIYDTINGAVTHKLYSLQDTNHEFQSALATTIAQHQKQIQKLISYKKSGFQKVEAIKLEGQKVDSLQCLIFISEDQSEHFRVVCLTIDAETFIQDMIGPRLQVVAREQFILSAFKKGTAEAIYSTGTAIDTLAAAEALTRDFWLFPSYTLGIGTKGSSLATLIGERTSTNFMLLFSLDVILILAVVLVFRNVKKEVALAQNKADFVSNVSHEIRTPLALISMFAETLEMDRVKTEEKKHEYYSIISKETHRLTGIVNKILNFSQAEANRKTLTIESIHPLTEIKEILNTYDFHLTSKGFTYSLEAKRDFLIRADREAFVEVFINLLDNAIKYSADIKHITITLTNDHNVGLITIKDAGIGISASDQKHIFDKFYRVTSGDLAKSRGTGLGLSLVKQLMDAQQGNISVSSELGKGSTFILYFQLSK